MRSTVLFLALLGALLSLQGAYARVLNQVLDCSIPAGDNSTLEFDSCATINYLATPLTIYWTVLPATKGATTRPVHFGLKGNSEDRQGYVALGFPVQPGRMVGASAFILQDSATSETGAAISGYYLGGNFPAQIRPPARLASSNLTADRADTNGQSWLVGSFVVNLASTVSIGSSINIIFAEGPISSTGSPLQHYTMGGGSLKL